MHISLDAALQRQPLLSTVGDKLLPAFPGAAAAYSLRALNGDANDVVNVRRDGDDGEREFTAEGVALELEDWVNGKLETTLPADVDTAAAAYSLRKVRNAYTGDAVQIRRTSDNVEVNVAFDSNGEVSDSSAITNVVESPDAGDTTATTLGDFIVPPSIQALYNQRVYFNGSNQNVVLGSQIDMTGDFSLQYSFIVSETNQQIIGRNTTGSYIRAFGSGTITAFRVQTEGGAVNLTLLSSINYNEAHTVKIKRVSGSWGIYDASDVLISNTASNSDTFALDSFGRGRGTYAKGVIWNIRVDTDNDGTTDHSYNGYGNTLSDWEDQVGSNDGTVNGSPALFTGQDFEATVVTWYDQSVNGNDATQDTTGSQPLIAENGSLVTQNGKPAISPDGIDDLFTIASDINLSVDFSIFAVSEFPSSDGEIFRKGNSTPSTRLRRNGGNINIIAIDAEVDIAEVSATSSGYNLYSALVDRSANLEFFQNGSSEGTASMASVGSGNSPTGEQGIFASSSGSNFGDGDISELIIYESDQSANRFKIESSINNYYGIYTPAEDGFVESWYDQSGNGNDATMTATAVQPRIVGDGSIITDSNGNPSIECLRSAALGTRKLQLDTGIPPMGTTSFAVVDYRRDFSFHLSGLLGGSIRIGRYTNDRFRILNGSETFVAANANFTLNAVHLATADIATSGGTTKGFVDGVEVISTDFPDANDNLKQIFRGDNNSDNPVIITELVIFGTNQSANRTAIESNIADEYGITLS